MKNILLLGFLIFMLASCSKSDDTEAKICNTELICDEEQCLFTLNNAQGITIFLTCYDSWSIRVPMPDNGGIWYIVDEWDAEYKVEGREVTFCGYVRENSLPLLFPDPMPGIFYQIRLEEIQIDLE